MNLTLFEIGAATVMVAVSFALIAWFSRDMAAASGRRMMRMLAQEGVDLEVAGHGDTAAIMQDVRRRCLRCPSEALCERWLVGWAEGENDFCPNAEIFRGLTRTAGRTAA